MRIRHMTLSKQITLSAAILLATSFAACSNANSTEPAQSASAPAVTTTKPNAPEPNWQIDAERSHIRFSALQEGKAFEGKFETFSGVIDFDPDAPEQGYVKIEIPLSGVDAGSRDRNSTLPDKVWFSTKAFPTATFISGNIQRDGDGYLAKGELTMKNVTLPVDLAFDLTVTGDRAVMTGQTTLDRTRWGVGDDPWNTDEWVSKAVEVNVQVTADRL